MDNWKRRVIRERQTLYKKFDKLSAFKDTKFFQELEAVDRNLLQEQWMAMKDYLDILDLRIDRF